MKTMILKIPVLLFLFLVFIGFKTEGQVTIPNVNVVITEGENQSLGFGCTANKLKVTVTLGYGQDGQFLLPPLGIITQRLHYKNNLSDPNWIHIGDVTLNNYIDGSIQNFAPINYNYEVTIGVVNTTRYYLLEYLIYRRNGSYVWVSSINTAYIEVKNKITDGGGIETDKFICSGTSTQIKGVTLPGGTNTGTINYQWQISSNGTDGWNDIAGANGINHSVTHSAGEVKYYRRRASNNCVEVKYSNVTRIEGSAILNAGAVQVTSSNVCYGFVPQKIRSTSLPSGGIGPFTYRWEESEDGVGGWQIINGASGEELLFSNPLYQNKYYRRVAINGCGQINSNVVALNVYNQLVGGTIGNNATICYNTAHSTLVNLQSASGGGGSISYQWQKSLNGYSEWVDLPGYTLSTLPSIVLTQTTYYRRRASDASGCGVVYSNIVTITVSNQLQPGSISGGGSFCYNVIPSSISSSSLATGGNGAITYQWQKNDSGTWENLVGETGVGYGPPALIKTTRYRRNAINTCGTLSSNEVTYTIYENLVPGQISGGSTICYGATPNVLGSISPASGGNGTTSYNWQSSLDGTSNWQDISGATGLTYQPGALTATRFYRRKASNSCGTVFSNIVTIYVNDQMVGGTIGTNSTVCYGGTPSLFTNEVPASGGGFGRLDLIWQSSLNGTTGWSDIAGAIQGTYQSGPLTQTTFFRRKSSGGCGIAYSNVIQVTVNAEFVGGYITTTSGNELTICNGSVPPSITNSTLASGGSGTISYQWQKNDNGLWENIVGAVSNAYSPGALIKTTSFRRMATNSCGTVSSNIVVVTVRPVIVPGTIAIAVNKICYNTQPGNIYNVLEPSGGTGSFSYSWDRSTSGTGGWQVISGETSNNYTPPVLTSTMYYRRREVNSCGAITSNIVEITVGNNVDAGSIVGNQNVCDGAVPLAVENQVEPTGGLGSLGITWEKSLNGVTGWQTIDGENQSNLQFSLPLMQTEHFRRKVENVCGTRFSNVVVKTKFNAIVGGSIGFNEGTQISVCYNTVPQKVRNISSASGGFDSFVYSWEKREEGSSEWQVIVGESGIELQNLAMTKTTYFRRKATNSCGSIYTNEVVVNVFNQFVPGVIADNQTLCLGSNIQPIVSLISPSGGSGAYTYQWEQSPTGTGNWSVIANENSLVYAPKNLSQTTFFRRKDTDACGFAYTNVIKIEISGEFNPGSITGAQNICYGLLPGSISNVNPASGGLGTITYTWEHSHNGSSNWSVIPGEVGLSYSPSNLYASAWYRRKAHSECGIVSSNVIKKTVYEPLTPGSILGQQVVCYGSVPSEITNQNFPTGGSGNYNYKWYKQEAGSPDFEEILGVNSASYQPQNVYSNTNIYRKVIDVCGEEVSNQVLITVRSPIDPGEIDGGQVLCYGEPAETITSVRLPSGGFGLFTFQWERSANGVSGWTVVTGQEGSTLSLGSAISSFYYRRRAINDCGSSVTNSVYIQVHGEMNGGIVSGNQVLCQGEGPGMVGNVQSPTGGFGTYQIQWEASYNNAVWFSIDGANSLNYNPQSMNQSTYFRRKSWNDCGVVYSNVVYKQLLQNFVSGTIGHSQNIDYGAVPAKLLTITSPSGGGGVYQAIWQISFEEGVWNNLNAATGDEHQHIALYQTSKFRKLVTDNTCGAKQTNEITILVYPNLVPGTIQGNQTVCYNGMPVEITNAGSPSGGNGSIDIRWERSIDNSTWTEIAGQIGLNLQLGSLTETTYLRRKVISGTLVRHSNVVLITVREPIIQPIVSGAGTFCRGTGVQLAVTNVQFGSSYEWYNSSQVLIGQGTSYNEGNLQESKKVYVRSKGANDCYSGYTEVSLNVDPINANFTQSHSNIAEGGVVLYYSTSVNASVFEWNFGMGEVYTEQNPSVYYNQPGTYSTRLKVWSTLGCFSEKFVLGSVVVHPYTTVDEEKDYFVKVYPNPTGGTINIESSFEMERLEIYSIVGLKVYQMVVPKTREIRLELAQRLSFGAYVLKLTGSGESKTIKIIVQ